MIFDILVFPIIIFLQTIFESINIVTSNYLVSIILLSFLVNIFLFPFSLWAQKLQNKEKVISSKLKAYIVEFKSVYKGSELNAVTSTLFRQHNYHPIYSLRSILGLLVQVPFFIAAFYFLSNYEKFIGVETILFNDLSLPDKWMSIGGFTINLMPFIMTLINIIAGYLYTKDMEKRDKQQLLFISLIFLILLYNSSSALLLYWTFNNIFSLSLSYIYKSNFFIKKRALSKNKIDKLEITSISRINLNIKVFKSLEYILISFAIISYILYFSILDSKSYEAVLLVNIMSISILGLTLLYFVKIVNKKSFNFIDIFSIFITCIFYSTIFLLYFNDSISVFFIKERVILLLLFLIFILNLNQINYILQNLKYNKKKQYRITKICLLIFCFIFLIIPSFSIISSSPSEFLVRYKIIGIILYSTFTFYYIYIYVYKYMGNSIKKIIFFSSIYFSIYSLFNFFVLSADYGIMDFFIFHDMSGIIVNKYIKLLDICILIFVTFFVIFLLKKVSYKKLYFILITVLLSLILNAVISFSKIILYQQDKEGTTIKAESFESKFHFSKNGKNVLILFFDRFIGGFVPEILKDIPSLKSDLFGFTWYPNTISVGKGTAVGLPAISGGYKYTNIKQMQESNYDWYHGWLNKKDYQIQDRFINSTKFMVKKFTDAGYKSFINDPSFINPKIVKSFSKNSFSENLIGKYTNVIFPDSKLLTSNIQSPLKLIYEYLLPYSLFNIYPPSLREGLYDEGKWWTNNKEGWVKHYIKNLALAHAFPKISSVDSNLKGSYMFATNMMTHEPYASLDNGRFQTGELNKNDNELFEKNKKRFKDENTLVHFYAAKEALVRTEKWIDWMKSNNVYDNTKIIIVSDHGRDGVYNPMFEKDKLRDNIYFNGYHPIFMVKDFNENGDLKIDNSFMTTADVPSIALSAIDKNAEKKYGYDKKKGFRLYTKEGSLKVFDNIFDTNNWIYTDE